MRTQDSFWKYPMTLVLVGGMLMGLALGIRHAQGLFLIPVTTDRAWSREAFGFAIALQNLVWGVAQPIAGMIADRFGSAKVMAVGVASYATGLLLMSGAANPVEFTLSAGVLIGAGLSGTAFGAVYGALSRMVPPEKRSWALGLAGAMGGFGQFAMIPLAQGLIEWLGWATALVAFGITMTTLLPLTFKFQDSPGPSTENVRQQSMQAALKEAFSHRGFWLLSLGFFACGFQLAFIATHLPAYLIDKGLTANDAVAGLAIIALTNVLGTYYCGRLGDLFRRKYLLAGVYFVRAVIMVLFVLLPISSYSLYAFCAISGFIWLGTVPLTNGLVSQIFGVRYVATLFGFIFLWHQLGSFLGVWLGGYVFDATRSYDLMWAGSILIGLIAAALHYPIDDREIVRSPVPSSAT